MRADDKYSRDNQFPKFEVTDPNGDRVTIQALDHLEAAKTVHAVATGDRDTSSVAMLKNEIHYKFKDGSIYRVIRVNSP